VGAWAVAGLPTDKGESGKDVYRNARACCCKLLRKKDFELFVKLVFGGENEFHEEVGKVFDCFFFNQSFTTIFAFIMITNNRSFD
jgi:hypothetical protein